MILALIDGDALVFAAGFVVKKPDPAHHAFNIVNNMIEKVMTKTRAADYKIYLGSTDHSNFRYSVATIQSYKENRQKQKRPDYEHEIRAFLFEKHNAIEVKGIETDDALGIEQMQAMRIRDTWLSRDPEGCETIICSNDKDLDMIPGWHFDLDFGKVRKQANGTTYKLKAYKNKDIYFITDPGFISLRKNKESGKQILCGGGYLWFCCQLLLGDTTDNIPKLAKGYGPQKVYEVLHDVTSSMWSVEEMKRSTIRRVYQEYTKVLKDSLTTEQIQARLMEIARLVWIKRQAKNDVIFPRSWLK